MSDKLDELLIENLRLKNIIKEHHREKFFINNPCETCARFRVVPVTRENPQETHCEAGNVEPQEDTFEDSEDTFFVCADYIKNN